MKITEISLSAVGYYSGNEYFEALYVSSEFYSKIKEQVEKLQICIAELDGKFSDVEGDIDTLECDDTEPFNFDDNDGDDLYLGVSLICQDLGLDLDAELERVKTHVRGIDGFVEMTVKVRKSNIEKVREFVKSLEEMKS